MKKDIIMVVVTLKVLKRVIKIKINNKLNIQIINISDKYNKNKDSI